ncbi:MAG: twin-arginine translocase TatA/TatE family subunit [Actinophytocola sp.]|nr:twin-arginine translocase TatA/TatE family subunit [Actinophytocola sp.]
MGNLGVPELLIIAGVIILLFGARKLPEMARSLGKSAKAFKEETKGMRGGGADDNDDTPEAPQAQPVVQQQLPQAQPATPAQAPAQNATTNGTQPVEQAQQNKNAG